MIVSIFVLDTHTNKKLCRSSQPMSASKMNYYLTEFNSLSVESEGFIEKGCYNYAYISNNVQKIGMQITKDHSARQATSILKFIGQNSTEDMFDMLYTIDNVLFGGLGLKLDLQPIKELDSQEEKIYKMMLENKKLEMAQKEKESRMKAINEQLGYRQPEVQQAKPKKIEKSGQPVLVIIKEKLRIEMNKENKIKENSVSGEVNLIISDAKYRQVQIKMKSLKPTLKYSPYLDKNALKKHILRFDKDRGLNKNIPLLKWTGSSGVLPLEVEFWGDEEDGKYVNTFEFKAQKNLKDLEIRFNRENASEVEVENGSEEGDKIVWRANTIKKGESRIVEVCCTTFDKDCLFPIEVQLSSEGLDTSIDVEKIMVEEQEIKEYEVRKILEIESFVIVAD